MVTTLQLVTEDSLQSSRATGGSEASKTDRAQRQKPERYKETALKEPLPRRRFISLAEE